MWKKVSRQTVFTNPRLTLVEDVVELPDGSQVNYLQAQPYRAAMVICIKGDQILLQKEYSYPPNEVLYQFPGGRVEDGEEPEISAARELVEEAGLKAAKLQKLGEFFVDNRRSSSKMYVFLATDPRTVPKVGGDLEESITSHWLPTKDIDEMIRKGELKTYTCLAGWALYKAWLAG